MSQEEYSFFKILEDYRFKSHLSRCHKDVPRMWTNTP